MSEEELVESLVEYLIQESYADNEESALVLIEHMSEGALENILEATATSGSVSNLNRAFNSKSASKGPSVRSRQHQGVSDKSGKGRSSGPSSSSRTDAGGKSRNKFSRRGKIAGQRTSPKSSGSGSTKTAPEKIGDSFRKGQSKVPAALRMIPGFGTAVGTGAGIGQVNEGQPTKEYCRFR